MKPTRLGRVPTFSKAAFAYSDARIYTNVLEISPAISFPICSTNCPSPSQNISLCCDWCFPKRHSLSLHLPGEAALLSMTHVTSNGHTSYRFRVVCVIPSGHPTAFTIRRTSVLLKRNWKSESASLSDPKVKGNLVIEIIVLRRICLHRSSLCNFH
jgi:hypothetical protein